MSTGVRTIAILMRHGDYHQLADTPSAHQPFPLTDKGRRQAIEAAAVLRQILAQGGWQLAEEVDASQQLRAWQTARLVCDELADEWPGLRLRSCDALAERGLGSAANLSLAQIAQAVASDPRCGELPGDWKSNSHFRLPLPGAESLMEAGERVARHLEARMAALAAEAGHGHMAKLFVGHGAAFRHAAHLLGVLDFDDIARLSMFHAGPVIFERAADGRWRHIGGRWKVRRGRAMD